MLLGAVPAVIAGGLARLRIIDTHSSWISTELGMLLAALCCGLSQLVRTSGEVGRDGAHRSCWANRTSSTPRRLGSAAAADGV
jgi:hypothetical protein